MLELKGIYKTFNAGTVNEKRAIDNLNLTLENGDFVTIIGGNAELLAEDALTPEQKAQVEAILQGAEQTRTYLGKIRAEVQTPLKYKTKKSSMPQ